MTKRTRRPVARLSTFTMAGIVELAERLVKHGWDLVPGCYAARIFTGTGVALVQAPATDGRGCNRR